MPDGLEAVIPPCRGADEILDWLVRYLATLLECEETSIGVDVPFNRFGMDSSSAVGMTGDLSAWLGFDLDPTLPYDYPTIETLARHLAEASAARVAVRSAV